MAVSRVLCALLVLAIAVATEAAKIETFNDRGCYGSGSGPTNTFKRDSGCQTFIDQASVLVTEISADTRVSFHNQRDCESKSQVGQVYGPVCSNMGQTKLRAVWIQGGSAVDELLRTVVMDG